MSLIATLSTPATDREFVVACLHHNGSLRERFTAQQQQTVRRAADGFGGVYGCDTDSLDLLWDWSHVRDSSPRAFARMAKVLRIWLEVMSTE